MDNNLELKAIASKIKLVAFDVDGVMTDGSLTFLEDGREIKTYNAKDGLGVVMLSKAGLITSIITARDNNVVKVRAGQIDIKELYMGQKNKVLALQELCKKYKLDLSQVAYMGDDLPDICVLREVALKCCPQDAVKQVKQECNFVSNFGGGKGAVRELCDFILKAQGFDYEALSKPSKQ
ncbi:MAG: HAD hydrolase family protein [Candidatus Gastranaerophilales bacterium]|nr:HAD hydrolase family protein [Candidatus Gastranaerophilales bacterium]